ncbi:hypothetical protein [Bailinhaonella thermotolerans]|uniref:Uncharacterized protein n=1 Tax=Bailinhaonella thermotolerans TaxID=1070861 RepID=A0A3A4A356_9ACTN|nr:hypothetical protein [Bailinhaonella thermotolerans]RJL23196.1 hypothetical protein D5H75_32985 [Bailinhaonella thermotolerans]
MPDIPPPSGPDRRDFLGAPLPYSPPHPITAHPLPRDGRRHVGQLEPLLVRQWPPGTRPSQPLVDAVDRLAELPAHLTHLLAGHLRAIYVGPGGVPELDGRQYLRGVPLDPARPEITWDLVAGCYGDGVIVVGDMPSHSCDVMLHEIGHALDHADGGGGMRSESDPDWRALHRMLRPALPPRYHHPRELFAEAFAACAAGEAEELMRLCDRDARRAEMLWVWFYSQYGVGTAVGR